MAGAGAGDDDDDWVLVVRDPLAPADDGAPGGRPPHPWARRVRRCGAPGAPERDSPLPRAVFEALYRHHHGAHLPDFAAADALGVRYRVNLYHGLAVVPAAAHGIRSPLDPRLPPGGHDTVFVLARPGGRHYLVNTEGHDYCRFVVPCDVVRSLGPGAPAPPAPPARRAPAGPGPAPAPPAEREMVVVLHGRTA